jgi:hypothetical protein
MSTHPSAHFLVRVKHALNPDIYYQLLDAQSIAGTPELLHYDYFLSKEVLVALYV